MSDSNREQVGEEATYDEAFETTFDLVDENGSEGVEEEVVSYLVPRLATYVGPSSSSSSSSIAFNEDEKGNVKNGDGTTHEVSGVAEEDYTERMVNARDSGERSAAHITDDGAVEESCERGNEEVGRFKNAETSSAMQTNERDAVYADSGVEDEEDDNADDRDDVDGTAAHYTSIFPHSRVKELLKYEGSSSIVSKDAAAAACEAVALLSRDLVATAAAEAARKNRKILTYDDLARVVQLLDRFSFLADVVPPAPSSSAGCSFGTSKSIVVGSRLPSSSNGGARKKNVDALARSKPAQRQGRNSSVSAAGAEGSAAATTRSKTAHARVVHNATSQGLHPRPGGMQKATLRF